MKDFSSKTFGFNKISLNTEIFSDEQILQIPFGE
jgi:hypothetical protein